MLTRRALLRSGGGLAAGAALAGLPGCSSPGAPRVRPAPGSGTPLPSTKVGPADWSALARDLAGHLIRPGDAGYPLARLSANPRFDSTSPAGIVECANPADVATCIGFARRLGVPITARAGGHSYAGYSTGAGLVVDVAQMSVVTPGGAAARIGAGARLIDVYSGLAGAGRTLPAGSCPSVGLAGLALGGGIGVTSRAYGLTCDAVDSVQIVTADGRVREVDTGDLFWACRGGGGGNFGIITAFTMATHPVGDVALGSLGWDWSAAPRVVDAWQRWAPAAPDELFADLHLLARPGAPTPTVGVGGTCLAGQGSLDRLFDRLVSAVGVAPSQRFSETRPFLHAMLVDAGCAALTVAECHLDTETPPGGLPRQALAAKSDLCVAPLPASGIATLVHRVELAQRIATAVCGVGFDPFGGEVNRVAPDATAFVHRDVAFGLQYTAAGAGAGSATALAWLRGTRAAMAPYVSGQAYQNYIDPDLANWPQAYYGANLPRLSAVKASYDPTRLFRFAQAIP